MQEKVLMKGNEAIAEAAIRCGCRHYLGYPITPQTEIAAYMAKRMPKIGGVFLQAESEIAAINMVYGVASTGKLAMTSSSSPGIALKCEGISYLAGADLPALIVNVQRGGPGLGGIQPSQSDYFLATRGPGHGDFHVLVLAPASVQEMADLTQKAFRLAFQYRMPAMLLADGTMGQMMEPVVLPEETVLEKSAPDWAVTGTECKRPQHHQLPVSLSGRARAEEHRALRALCPPGRKRDHVGGVHDGGRRGLHRLLRHHRPRLTQRHRGSAQMRHQGRHDPSDHALALPG